MANGLIGGFGSFGQAQGQQQGNLLGGVFQQQPTRGQRRAGLLRDTIQQFGGNAQQTGGAAIGAGLGVLAGSLLGGSLPGQERADKIRRVQNQVSQEQGLNFATDPQQAFMRTAELLQGEGLQQEAIQAMMQARQFAPEQPEVKNVRELTLENGDTVLAGTIGNRSVRITGEGPVPLEGDLAGESPSRTERQKKRDYYIGQGFDQRTANDLANGMIKFVTDPVSGQSSLRNLTGGPVPDTLPTGYDASSPGESVVPEEEQPAPQRPGEPEPVPGQPDRPGILDQPIESVGLVPYLKEGVERTAGQFVDAANYPEVTRQRSNLRQTSQQLITSLSISGRPPVMEQERINQMTASLGPLESPERARLLMEEVAESALQQRQADLEAINNEELNPSLRKDLQARVNSTERMLRLLDPRSIETGALTSPKDLTPEQASSVIKQGIQDGALPSNAEPGAFDLENNGYPILQDGEPLLDPQGNPYYIFPDEDS